MILNKADEWLPGWSSWLMQAIKVEARGVWIHPVSFVAWTSFDVYSWSWEDAWDYVVETWTPVVSVEKKKKTFEKHIPSTFISALHWVFSVFSFLFMVNWRLLDMCLLGVCALTAADGEHPTRPAFLEMLLPLLSLFKLPFDPLRLPIFPASNTSTSRTKLPLAA